MKVTQTDRNINKLSVNFKSKVEGFLQEAGKTVFISEAFRSQERQNYLYSLGRTRNQLNMVGLFNVPAQPSKSKVTWTLTSNHSTGNAIDIAFHGKELYPKDINKWKAIAKIANKYGIDWGYDLWNRDKPHFQDNGKIFDYAKNMREKYNLPVLFRGVKLSISDKPKESNPKANASYLYKTNEIMIYPKFFEHTEDKRNLILEHEFCHYIHVEILYKFHRGVFDLWKEISKGKHLGEYKKNAYVTEYAEKNYFEDFAETVEEYIKDPTRRYGNYADKKTEIALKIMRQYVPNYNY